MNATDRMFDDVSNLNQQADRQIQLGQAAASLAARRGHYALAFDYLERAQQLNRLQRSRK
jgi:hypothetical protein